MKEFSDGSPIYFETSVTTRGGRKDVLDFVEAALAQV
ncbi:MAG: hypothetical protein ACJAQT_004344 [Akkermansiaceae bacterium]|jgi:hypothetical protein